MIDLDTDPRLTAYALDELDRDEREIFKQDLANTGAEPGELIAEIKALAQMLDEIYANEPELRMTDQQRVAVLDGDGVVAETEVAEDVAYEDGKMLPWVVRPTISKEKAAVAELCRPSRRRCVCWAIFATGIAACFFVIPSFVTFDKWEDRAAEPNELVVSLDAEQVSATPSPPLEVGENLRSTIVIDPGAKEFEQIDRQFSSLVLTGQPSVHSLIAENTTSDPDAFREGGDFGAGSGRGGVGGGGRANDGNRMSFKNPATRYRLSVDPGTTRDWNYDDGGRTVTEAYSYVGENIFKDVLEEQNQLSTFSIDVDTAAYANVRRMLRAGQKPPAAAVRIEEMVNYFKYAYPQPEGAHPFSANLEVASCPWTRGNRLVRIGLKGRETEDAERPDSNLVFLIDVSGSMQSPNKLSLLKASMMELVKNLREQDSVSIVAYAGSSGLVLGATSGALQDEILSAIGRLNAGGSTNGGAGITLAYSVAKENFIKGGVNRVILATDGDFNVGVTDQGDLVKMVADRAKENIYLTVLGFGSGNLKDDLIEEISNRGNGNSFYIDSAREGHKVLVEEMGSTLETIAKDVKIQVEFNPAHVRSYRLIGYENRRLRNRDFNDDKIDAGEVGAGHAVTALYEIVPVGAPGEVDELKYSTTRENPEQRKNVSPELLTVKMRYKQPEGNKSVKFDAPLVDAGNRWEESTGDFRFAASVAGFGMLLRESQHQGSLNFELVKELAGEGIGEDPKGYRKEFLELVELARKSR